MIIKIEDKMECGRICKLIQKMLSSYAKSNKMENKAISINIVDVVEQSTIKRLEYKNEEENRCND
jgi:hypothetical protein